MNTPRMEANRDRHMFGGNRLVAIARDGYKCTECGMSNDEHVETFNRGLSVHHIDKNGCNKRHSEKNNDLDNLVTLCLKCHSRIHQTGRNTPQSACNNKSGYRGVCWSQEKGRWYSAISFGGKKIHIGCFGSREEAARAYNKVAIDLRGDSAILNEVPDESL